jgi:hydroxymethylbilane synthase
MLRVATRGSRLARWQADHVVSLLGRPAELVIVSTEGDRRPDVELHAIGGQGVFVKDVQRAVLEGRADLAVHSAKDLPSQSADGLVIAAVPARADARDALVGSRLADVPEGGSIGSDSVRRRAQLAAARPDLRFGSLRGNIETRLEKASGFDAVVIALCALERLGLTNHVAEVLDAGVMLPQVGQGALAVECRSDDDELLGALAAIEHLSSRYAVDAERAFLAELGGGCDVPCGAHATVAGGDTIALDAVLASVEGTTVLRAHVEGDDRFAVGRRAATQLLDTEGGRALLEVLP